MALTLAPILVLAILGDLLRSVLVFVLVASPLAAEAPPSTTTAAACRW